MIKDVFIEDPINSGWIIEKLMQDIALQLQYLGVRVKIGPRTEYSGEAIVFHSRYLYAKPILEASLNSVFVTHVDDAMKEFEIKSRFNDFESFVCMSPSDAEYLRALGCKSNVVVGINLPHRGGIVRPKKIAIFSDLYKDKRKNAHWLLEYFQSSPIDIRRSFIVVLLGHHWEDYCKILVSLGVSYELHCYDRKQDGEYEFQKELLANCDYLLYPGFDGGAMCIYDALAAGNQLIIANSGYHQNLKTNGILFSDKKEFFDALQNIAADYINRKKDFSDRSIEAYVAQLVAHWNELLNQRVNNDSAIHNSDDSSSEVLSFYRGNYKNVTFRRLASSLYRVILNFLKK